MQNSPNRPKYKNLLSTDEYIALYKKRYDVLFRNGIPTMDKFCDLNVLIFLGSEKQEILVGEWIQGLIHEIQERTNNAKDNSSKSIQSIKKLS